mmetsp:Transcript_92754/g.276665  ORF Transcript_92754/g.276665 Transcript_92754/m.276665 type:complete len:208 (+) Transcript_92754:228-851(+)
MARQILLDVARELAPLAERLKDLGALHLGAHRRAQHLQDHQRHGEDVRRGSGVRAALRGAVGRGAHDALLLEAALRLGRRPGQPEIADLEGLAADHENVGGLQVPVDEARTVDLPAGLCEVLRELQLQRQLLCTGAPSEAERRSPPALRVHPAPQRGPIAELHLHEEHDGEGIAGCCGWRGRRLLWEPRQGRLTALCPAAGSLASVP